MECQESRPVNTFTVVVVGTVEVTSLIGLSREDVGIKEWFEAVERISNLARKGLYSLSFEPFTSLLPALP